MKILDFVRPELVVADVKGRDKNAVVDELAAHLAANVPGIEHQHLNRVLLLTDGEPTAGIKDFPSIVNQVAEHKNRGISITALGFGSEYNEELMAGIARRRLWMVAWRSSETSSRTQRW